MIDCPKNVNLWFWMKVTTYIHSSNILKFCLDVLLLYLNISISCLFILLYIIYSVLYYIIDGVIK